MYAKPFLQGVLASSSIVMYLTNKYMNSKIEQYRLMYEENLMYLIEDNKKS